MVDRYQYISQFAWSPDTFHDQLEQRLWCIFFRTAELLGRPEVMGGSGVSPRLQFECYLFQLEIELLGGDDLVHWVRDAFVLPHCGHY